VTDAVQAEWIKLRTLPSIGWLLVGVVVVTVAVSAVVAAVLHVNPGNSEDPTKLSLAGIQIGQALVAVFAVLAASEEFGTGMIRVTLSAMPRRIVLLAAKGVNVAGLTLVPGILAITGCLIAGRLLLPDSGINPAHGYAFVSISEGSTLQAATGSVLYLILIALLSLGVATAIRDTAASVGAVLGLLYIPPVAAQLVGNPAMRRHLEQIAPTTAGLAIQATTNLRSLPIAPWAGLSVLVVWALVSLLVGGLLLCLRDA
jgi:ABC-2 type transport system permease protein